MLLPDFFLGVFDAILAASLISREVVTPTADGVYCFAVILPCPSYNVVANAWQIFNASSSNQHSAMLIQVVSPTRNVGGYFHSIAESNTDNLSFC